MRVEWSEAMYWHAHIKITKAMVVWAVVVFFLGQILVSGQLIVLCFLDRDACIQHLSMDVVLRTAKNGVIFTVFFVALANLALFLAKGWHAWSKKVHLREAYQAHINELNS